jgi:hypothetical protein
MMNLAQSYNIKLNQLKPFINTKLKKNAHLIVFLIESMRIMTQMKHQS